MMGVMQQNSARSLFSTPFVAMTTASSAHIRGWIRPRWPAHRRWDHTTVDLYLR